MAFRIRRKEDIAAALLRLAGDDLRSARRDLAASDRREERIHKSRQRLKRVRTILRILEPQFGERAVAARRELAETARLLASARDADVAAANARELASMPGEDLGFARAAMTLEMSAAEAHRQRTPVDKVRSRLTAVIDGLDCLDPDFDGRSCLAWAIERSYRKGRRAMRQAEATLSTPDFHRWRKSVKNLWHVLLLARPRLPKRSAQMAGRLDQLGELLGRDNDHALLAEKLALSPAADHRLMSQLAVIARQRNRLEGEAFDLGRRLYRRKSRDFARRTTVR
jgi:CHAD domain-containing protein